MPIYDYQCDRCGPFTLMRPMAEYDRPQPCPACNKEASRALLTAPAMTLMNSGLRNAHAVNERSANVPGAWSRHASGCRCCSGNRTRTAESAPAAKTFPGSRPWMLGH